MTPARIFDSASTSWFDFHPQGALGSADASSIYVAGRGNVPASSSQVTAVALNVTVYNQSIPAGGCNCYLQAYSGTRVAGGSSTVNWNASSTPVANMVITQLDWPNGTLSLYNNQGSTQVIVDVVGYFTPDTSKPGYVELSTPYRQANGLSIGPNAVTTVDFSSSPVPSTADVVFVNVTVGGGGADSYFTSWVYGGTAPPTSNVNVKAGSYRSALIAMDVDAARRANFYNFAGTQTYWIDVVGYTTSGGAIESLSMMNPAQRVYDTRPGLIGYAGVGALAAGETRNVTVAGTYGVPASAQSVVVNLGSVNNTAQGGYQAWATGDSPPPTAALFHGAGQDESTLTITKVGANGQISIYNPYGSTDLYVDVDGFFGQSSVPATTGMAVTATPLNTGDVQVCVTPPSGPPVDSFTITAAPADGGFQPGSRQLAANRSAQVCDVFPGSTAGSSTSVQQRKQYSFSAKPVNTVGAGAAVTSSVVTVKGVPYASTGPTGSPNANGTVHVSWTAPTNDGGVAISSYVVRRYVDAVGTPTQLADPAETPASCAAPCTSVDYPVPAGARRTPYRYSVQAVNGIGAGDAAFTASVTAKDVPDAPYNVQAQQTSAQGPQRAAVTWNQPPSNGGAVVTSYDVFAEAYNLDANGNPQRVPAGQQAAADKSYSCPPIGVSGDDCFAAPGHYTATNLGAYYYLFKVRAANSVGPGPWSAYSGGVFVDQAAPTITKTATNPTTGALVTTVNQGDTVAYKITATNATANNISLGSLNDTVPNGLAVQPDTIRIYQADGTTWSPCTSATSCTVDPKLASVAASFSNVVLNPSQARSITFSAVAVGGIFGCGSTTNNATATNHLGATLPVASSVSVCDSGLGREAWESFIDRPTGPQGTAAVNVANGNLVVTQDDGTDIQAHGRLDLVIRRTYNSQEKQLGTLPGSIGAGWQLNVGQTGDLAGTGLGGSSLIVPAGETLASPGAVTLVDRDGTRHTFTPRLPTARLGIDPTNTAMSAVFLSAASGHLCVDQAYTAPEGVHLSLWRYVAISSGTTCASWAGAAPTGVVVGWAAVRPDRVRYEFDATGRTMAMTDPAGNMLRYVWDTVANAQMVSVSRLTGVFEATPTCPATNTTVAAGCRAISVTYPTTSTTFNASSPAPFTNKTRWEVRVTDPAGRVTSYWLTGKVGETTSQLTEVTNPDGTTLTYTYQGVEAATCSGAAGQICSIGDPNNAGKRPGDTGDHSVLVGYQGTPSVVTTLTDRRRTQASFRYSGSCAADPVTGASTGTCTTIVDEADNPSNPTVIHRQKFSGIDQRGRVALLEEGSATPNGSTSASASDTGAWLHRTYVDWDGRLSSIPGAPATNVTCRAGTTGLVDQHGQPALTDNLTCRMLGVNTGSAGNDDTSWTYNPEGRPLTERRTVDASTVATTTWGYQAQYVQAGSATGAPAITTATDTVTGGGGVTSGARPSNTTSNFLYVVSDLLEELGPRGNAASTSQKDLWKTTWSVDANTSVRPGATPTGPVCRLATDGNGSTTRYNTGLTCSTSGPAWDQTSGTAPGNPTVTLSEYDTYGQKTKQVSPKAWAERSPDKPDGTNPTTATDATRVNGALRATVYAYYADAEKDVDGAVTAGGWLKSISDPTSDCTDQQTQPFTPNRPCLAAFAYDRASDLIRTWDRNATNKGPADAVFTGSARPHTDTINGSTTNPWRYTTKTIDPLGNTTVAKLDRNGNPLIVRTPRGVVAGTVGSTIGADFTSVPSTPYDAVATYTVEDDTATLLAPGRSSAVKTSTWSYDVWGNAVSATSPLSSNRDQLVTTTYDAVNRPTATRWIRSDATAGEAAGACTLASGSDPIVAYRSKTTCTTTVTYDDVDNQITSVDGDGTTTLTSYDAGHRPAAQTTYRTSGSTTPIKTGTVYDVEDHAIEICTPREFATGDAVTDTASPGRANACSLASNPATQPYSTRIDYDRNGRPYSTSAYRLAAARVTARSINAGATYDADGNATALVDPNGTTVTTTFNLLDRAITTSTPRSSTNAQTTTRTYDPVGNLTRLDEPRGDPATPGRRYADYVYDADNRLSDATVASTTADAVHTRQAYDPDGNVIATWPGEAFAAGETADRHATRTAYDYADRPTATYAPRYDSSGAEKDGSRGGNTEQVQNCPTGVSFKPYPDRADLPQQGWPGGTVGVCTTKVDYDDADRPVTVTLPTAPGFAASRTRATTYTDDGLIRSVDTPSPTGTGRATTSFKYSGAGDRLSTTDPSGRIAATSYSADHLPLSTAETTSSGDQTNGSGMDHTTSTTYAADGSVIRRSAFWSKQTAPQSLTCTPASPSTDVNCSTIVTLTSDGLTAKVDAPGAIATSDRLVATYDYDANGNATSIWDPAASWTHDHVGSPDPTNPVEEPTRLTYTLDNLPLTSVTPAGVDTTTTPFLNKRSTVTYGYDAYGHKASQSVTTSTRSTAVSNWIDQPGGTETFTYRDNGLINVETPRSGTGSITHAYDAGGRQTSVVDTTSTSPNSAATLNFAYYLDSTLRTATQADQNGLNSWDTLFAYDGSGNLASRDHLDGAGRLATSVTHNDAGLPAVLTQGLSGHRMAWQYDAVGSPTRSDNGNWNGTGFVASTDDIETMTYAADHTLTSKTTVTAGSAATGSSSTYTYAYDNLRRLTSQTAQVRPRNGTADSFTAAWTYDQGGRLVTHDDGHGTTRNTTWDHNSNHLTDNGTAWTYNPDNTVNTAAKAGDTNTYVYDNARRLSDDGCTQSSYDGFDRLTSSTRNVVNKNDAAAATSDMYCGPAGPRWGSTVAYQYDPLDRQTSATLSYTAPSTWTDGNNVQHTYANPPPTNTTTIRHDSTGQAVLAELASVATAPSKTYIVDASGRQAVARTTTNGASTVEYPHTDGTGNVTDISDGGLNFTCNKQFSPYGDSLRQSTTPDPTGSSAPDYSNQCNQGSTKTTAGANGQRQDETRSTYQLGGRTYSPTTGGFNTADSYRTGSSGADLGLSADPYTQNRYSYVNGDPLNYWDPYGHFSLRKWASKQYSDFRAGVSELQGDVSAINQYYVKGDHYDELLADGAKAYIEAEAIVGGGAACAYGADWLAGPVAGGAAGAACSNVASQVVGNINAGSNPLDINGGQVLDAAKTGAVIGFFTFGLGELFSTLGPAATTLADDEAGVATATSGSSTEPAATTPTEPAPAPAPIEEAGPVTAAGDVAESGGGAATALEDAAQSCSVNSFTAATPVLLASGVKVPISEVRVGDTVLATDPETGETAARPVSKVIIHDGEHTMVDLTLADGSKLTATDRHPLWDATTGKFTYAIDLHALEQVREANGTLLTISAVRVYDEDVTAFNLTVEGIHTYYAGTTPVLVHNSCSAYEIGPHNELVAKSDVGDGLDLHHVPQGHPAGQVIPGYDYSTAPSIALPSDEHALIPNLRGPFNGTPADLLERNLLDLEKYTNTPASVIKQLRRLVHSKYPGAF